MNLLLLSLLIFILIVVLDEVLSLLWPQSGYFNAAHKSLPQHLYLAALFLVWRRLISSCLLRRLLRSVFLYAPALFFSPRSSVLDPHLLPKRLMSLRL